jgi:hypothetical protein
MIAKQTIEKQVDREIERVRSAVAKNRGSWPALVGIQGINERWLRAFMSGQIKRPPAHRFLAMRIVLHTMRVIV